MSGQQPDPAKMIKDLTDIITRAGTSLHYLQIYQQHGGQGNLEQVKTHVGKIKDMATVLELQLRELSTTEELLSNLDDDLAALERGEALGS